MHRRLLVTLAGILIFRAGQTIPLPGVHPHGSTAWSRQGDVHGLVDVLTGGALPRRTVLGLGVWPVAAGYIGIALLTLLVPRLAAYHEQGSAGSAVLARHARILSIVLGAAAACAVTAGHPRGRSTLTLIALTCCLTAGAAVTLLLTEWITERGLGDGFAILLLTQLTAVLPGHLRPLGWTRGTITAACVLAALAILVQLRRTARMLPVQYQRTGGLRVARTTYLPIRVMPATFVPLAGAGAAHLALRAWTGLPTPWCLAASATLALLLALIAAPTALNPTEIANDLVRRTAFIPGIRPGRPTAEFLAYVAARVSLPGTLAAPLLTLLVLAPAPSLGAVSLAVLVTALRTFEQLNLEARTTTHSRQ